MKRSARILRLATSSIQSVEIDLFDSTCVSPTHNNEESSHSSDLNFSPSSHTTSSDEFPMGGTDPLEPINPVCVDLSESPAFQKENTLLDRDKFFEEHIQKSSNINIFPKTLDSDINNISNSPFPEINSTESEVTKPVSSLVNKITTVDNGDIDDNNDDIQEDDCENINKIPNQPLKKKIVSRGKDFCYYCEGFVLNFARHLLRQHVYETEVQKILSKPKKSIERKHLITELRKKGNYIQNSVEVTRPMRKQNSTDYLPCTNCLGFYAKRHLWKHKKMCAGETSKNVQSEAQNLLIRHLKIDENLISTVFTRMRADKVSLVAKSDVLICAFGSKYLKTHKEQRFVNVVSRKMRELAKLLIELKKSNPSVNNFFDALRPENYDDIVSAIKVVGKYDAENDRFDSPTFAMNISTSIKQCCNIAIKLALKKQGPYTESNTDEIEADLNTLIHLIESNWKFDISSQAATDLNKNKLNKVTIISLANDLKILLEFLNKKSEEAVNKIKEGSYNVATYIQLLETVFCRVLVLNRRRPGELQRIKVHDYLESDNNASENYEEFDRTLTASEQILVKKCKRVVIRGKCGRGVLVLFTKEIQEDIKILFSIRDKFVSASNKLLFGNPGFENSIYGYKVLERYSKLSGAKNPKAISSTSLKKYLATLSQIFSMTENEKEQLAAFMGHTKEVHKKSYTKPDDVYQTAKISKLLILMENRKADAYKGKCLDDIDLDLIEELEEINIENEDILYYDLPMTNVPSPMSNQTTTSSKQKEHQPGSNSLQNKSSESDFQMTLPSIRETNVKKGKKRTLVPWTAEQKKIVIEYFKHHIKNKQPPKRKECDTLKEQYPDLLLNKDWLKIKVYVQNTYSKR